MALELITHLDVSAASGLVHHEGALYAVADDGLELLRTGLEGERPHRLPLTEAPAGAPLAKKLKPDLEALLFVDGALLALGSGSSPARRRGLRVTPSGERLAPVDLSPLFAALSHHFSELNLEGAVARGDDVFLAQRGNGAKRENALVRLDRASFEAGVHDGVLTAACLRGVLPVRLGALHGVALSLTDLALGPGDALLFTAAAEDTDDPYDDGAVAGSIVGTLSKEGEVEARSLVEAPRVKLEGLCRLPDGTLRLVADPDDPALRAPLFRLGWPG